MQSVIDDFAQRKIEIEKYFEFVSHIENGFVNLSTLGSSGSSYRIDDEHLKIFRANGFLILYNLIESTILNCIVSIFDEISIKEVNSTRISYKDVTYEIKKYWLKHKYNHDERIKKESVVNQFYILCEDITNNVSLTIDSEKVSFGGNLDALKIRELAQDLLIPLNQPHYKGHLHGEALKKIKIFRNSLAHGEKSFSNIGKNVTYIGDGLDGTRGLGLKHFKEYTIEHLESFIDNIQDFITNERYLIAS